jgi:hypothetical protein
MQHSGWSAILLLLVVHLYQRLDPNAKGIEDSDVYPAVKQQIVVTFSIVSGYVVGWQFDGVENIVGQVFGLSA